MAPSLFLRTAVLLASSMIALLPGLARAQASQPLAPEQFTACVQALAAQTHLAGRPLNRTDFERIASAGRYDDRVRQSMQVTVTEPTFWWDELAATTDEERVQAGRGLITEVATDAETGAILYGTTDLLLANLGINSLDELPHISPLLDDGQEGFDRD